MFLAKVVEYSGILNLVSRYLKPNLLENRSALTNSTQAHVPGVVHGKPFIATCAEFSEVVWAQMSTRLVVVGPPEKQMHGLICEKGRPIFE